MKRSMKNFTTEIWNNALSKKEWTKVVDCEDLDEKVEIFYQFIEEALNEVAPIRSFTVKSKYKLGFIAFDSIPYSSHQGQTG